MNSKNLLRNKVLLPVHATCCQSLVCTMLIPSAFLEPDTHDQKPGAMPMQSAEWSRSRHLGRSCFITRGLKHNFCLYRCHGTFFRGPMVHQLCTEIVGFIMYHLGDAVPSKAGTLWFLVIRGSPQLVCSLAVQMLVHISVILGLPNEHGSVANVGVLGCSNLRIADWLYPLSWYEVFENVEHGCPLHCSCGSRGANIPLRVTCFQEG